MKIWLILMGILFSSAMRAAQIIDLYGDEPDRAQQIIKRYSAKIIALQTSFFKQIAKPNFDEKSKDFLAILEHKELLKEQIKKEQNYLYVNFETIFYPHDPNQYTTIEVIKNEQIERLKFIRPHLPIQDHKKTADLIEKMIHFNQISAQMMINNQLNLRHYSCAAYHCLPGFNHPQLKPYFKLFNQAANSKKAFIVKTINKDTDPERRAAAVFLIGHLQNPREIISLLLPHVNDSNDGVRNNVMRVIAMTITKANIHDIDALPFVQLLSSPYATDRNKSLYILTKLAESHQGKQTLLQHGKANLLALLQLQQPNNHDNAYKVLRVISNKEFADRDINAWKNWLANA